MPSRHWKRLQDKTSPEDRRFARQSLDLVDELHFVLREKGWNQKELARQLGKSESEISKWLSPAHNMTLKTVAKLEAILKVDLLLTPLRSRAKRQAELFGSELESQHYKAIISGLKQRTVAVSVTFNTPYFVEVDVEKKEIPSIVSPTKLKGSESSITVTEAITHDSLIDAA